MLLKKLLTILSILTFSTASRAENILLVGDSLGVGMSPRLTKLGRDVGITVKSHVKSGTTVHYWTPRIEKILQETKPELVLVSLGTNDGLADLKTLQHDVCHFVWAVDTSGAKLVWLGPPMISKKLIPRLDQVRGTIMDEVGMDRYLGLDGHEVQRAGDGIHATGKGYADWVDWYWGLAVDD